APISNWGRSQLWAQHNYSSLFLKLNFITESSIVYLLIMKHPDC
ncbi:16610_t:CDS:1, partial [Rhizophagus irregularis]